jgi:hypothetical protein
MIPDDAAQQAAALALGFNLTHSFGSLDSKWENRRSVRLPRHVHQNGRTATATVPASTGLCMRDFVRCMAALNHNRIVLYPYALACVSTDPISRSCAFTWKMDIRQYPPHRTA